MPRLGLLIDSSDSVQSNKDQSQHCQNNVGDGIEHSRWARRLAMSKAYLLTTGMIGLAVFLLPLRCQAQGNIDRGKTPAQAFAETCAACHRGPRALKRTSAAFLREHYSVSSAEAAAMAAYLAGFPSEPVQQSKRPPASAAETRIEAAKQHTKRQPIAGTAERATASQPSGERPADITEMSPAPPVADLPVTLAPPPKPVLEPFEE
jgi:hypothetical protein